MSRRGPDPNGLSKDPAGSIDPAQRRRDDDVVDGGTPCADVRNIPGDEVAHRLGTGDEGLAKIGAPRAQEIDLDVVLVRVGDARISADIFAGRGGSRSGVPGARPLSRQTHTGLSN
jgi:hypothetical protein